MLQAVVLDMMLANRSKPKGYGWSGRVSKDEKEGVVLEMCYKNEKGEETIIRQTCEKIDEFIAPYYYY